MEYEREVNSNGDSSVWEWHTASCRLESPATNSRDLLKTLEILPDTIPLDHHGGNMSIDHPDTFHKIRRSEDARRSQHRNLQGLLKVTCRRKNQHGTSVFLRLNAKERQVSCLTYLLLPSPHKLPRHRPIFISPTNRAVRMDANTCAKEWKSLPIPL